MSRGQYNRKRHGAPRVGLSLFHTPSDSDQAVRQIDTEMTAILDATYAAMGVSRPDLHWGSADGVLDTEALDEWAKLSADEKGTITAKIDAAKAKAQLSPLWGFFQAVVSPNYADWMKFRRAQEFYNVFTSWDEYETWLERVRALRAQVEDKGIDVQSPAPVDLTKTLPADVVDAAKKGAKDVWDLAKLALYGALGIGAVIAITSVVQTVRKGDDPVDKYYRMAKGLRR